MSLSEAGKEAIYLRSFSTELDMIDLADIVIYNDNLGAKKLAENPMFHSRSKHIACDIISFATVYARDYFESNTFLRKTWWQICSQRGYPSSSI